MATTRKQNNNSSVLKKELTVLNKLGIHARPAALFVKVASKFSSEITVEKDGESVNGKSIMGLMMLAAAQGSRLRISAAGDDADEALRHIEELFVKKFNED